jgi:hypothetical protein
MTFLKWEKTGVRTWYGAAGSYRYTIAKNLDGRYYVERLGKKWAVANTLQSAKDAAHKWRRQSGSAFHTRTSATGKSPHTIPTGRRERHRRRFGDGADAKQTKPPSIRMARHR